MMKRHPRYPDPKVQPVERQCRVRRKIPQTGNPFYLGEAIWYQRTHFLG